MTEQAVPKVFVSYSHNDVRVARRLFRRLTAHGVTVWMDEQELRLGVALSSSIRNHIQSSHAVIVIASAASAAARWVGLELEFAKEKGTPIVPLFIEDLSEYERFRDHLGLRISSPQAFEETVFSLMRDLFRSFDLKLPAADPVILTAGLHELATEEPDLAPLILGCLKSQGLNQTNMGTVYRSAFHPLDYSLNALFDVMPNELIANHAAHGFCRAGSGTRALFSWIAATGDGDLPLVTAVGERLAAELINPAIELLASCNPPNNHALYQFVERNANWANAEQRGFMVRLVTWPVRDDTARLADVLGWVASKHFPDTVEIQQMWSHWVYSGSFDGSPSSQADLARYLADAHKERLPGWEPIQETLRDHVRALLRSGDKNKVVTAIDHLQAAADAQAPVLVRLLREAEGVSGTAEWNDWRKRDPETAEFMGWYVHDVVEEAKGDRDWLRAINGAHAMVEFQEKRKRLLERREENNPENG
jgi:hypothetical protein